MIIGIDGGNKEVKIFGPLGPKKFLSNLGEYRERNLDQSFGEDDMVYEYNGEKGFAGTLAKYESEFVRSRMGESKAHKDLLIRVLLGLHRYSTEREYQIVVGQPISKHNKVEKAKIKNMLQGTHLITVNGQEREITIRDVEVTPEGACAFWAQPTKGKVRILDFGSGTVNGATIVDGRYIDKDSFTLPYGMESTVSTDRVAMANSVAAHALKKWDIDDNLLLVGGAADTMLVPILEHFKNPVCVKPSYQQGEKVTLLPSVYANAVAMYTIGKGVFANG